jgi:hypothetical protein
LSCGFIEACNSLYSGDAVTGKWGKETSNWKTHSPRAPESLSVSYVFAGLARLEWSHSRMKNCLNCTEKRGDLIASFATGQAKAGDSRSNEPPSTRTRKLLGNLPRFRLPARARQRNGPTYYYGMVPWSRMLTLATVSNREHRKHRSRHPSRIPLNYPFSARSGDYCTTVASLARMNRPRPRLN